MSMLLHCGAESVSRQELAAVPTPAAMGPRHHPYPYVDFVDQVENAMQAKGLRIADERYGLLKDGSRFFGLMELETYDNRERDFALTVGLRGSHDQSFSRGLVAGSRVFVCDNLCFSGEIKINAKQTTHIESRMAGMVYNAVQGLDGLFRVQDARFDNYRLADLEPRWGDAALVELLRRDVLTSAQLARAVREWDEPSHPEHAEDGHTVWRLHNAITEAMKVPVDENGRPSRAAAPMLMTRTVQLTSFLDAVAGFEPAVLH